MSLITVVACSRCYTISTAWCGDCRRVRRFLDERGVPYTSVDVDQDAAAAAEVARLNRGMQSIPTLVFADDSTLVEPSNGELARKLGRA